MTQKQYIEYAIEGGYEPDLSISNHPSNFHRMLLDPLAWQAVARVLKWSSTPQNYTTKLKILGTYKPVWQLNMHRFIDALCDGKSVDDFLETL